MRTKKIIAVISLLVLFAAGITAAISIYESGSTYDGSDTDVYELYHNPEKYKESDPDGIADIIVKENLAKTKAANTVSAVVFDFRGFDTMGESFILITAVAGSLVILRTVKKKEGEDNE